MPVVRQEDAGLVTSKGKPIPPDRNLAPPLWDLLDESERRMWCGAFGLPDGWQPRNLPPMTAERALETTEELERLMQMLPRRILQWKEKLIERNQPKEDE